MSKNFANYFGTCSNGRIARKDQRLGEAIRAAADTQGIDSRIDLAALAFEVAYLRRDLLRQQTHLEFRLAGILSSASKDVMNLGQREPELFAFKNHLEMKPVADIVPADW